ncbi:MAG: hypothetical protein ACRD0Y_11375 [Terriglobales bacterium]
MLEIPAHMFAFQRVIGARAAPRGYYFAHVFPAKNRDIAFRTWPRSEVVRRFYLTLHPCNFFLVPGGRTLGEDPKLIRFVASLYCRRYAPTWRKFLERTGASAASLGTPDPNDVVHSGATRAKSGEPRGAPLPGHVRHSSRLCFKRDVIEPLAWDQPFEVVTRFGTYRFTKRQFYEAFPNIPATRSYREQGYYNGAKLHLKAERFRVPRAAAAADSQQ